MATIKEIASIIAKLEGRKSQVKIGDIREILSLISAYDAANRVKTAEKYNNEDYLDQASLAIFCLDQDAKKKAHKAFRARRNKK